MRLNDDGNYTLLIGSTDMGTGSDTILAQMAAEILDTTVESIIVHAADTDVSPYDPGSYASSTTYVTGMAVVKAAEELKQKIIDHGAKILEVSPEDVEFDGKTISTVAGEKELSLTSKNFIVLRIGAILINPVKGFMAVPCHLRHLLRFAE